MKRKILVLLLVLATAVSAFTLAACGGKKSGGDDLRITSFEDYDELTQMRWLHSFGKAELSDEHVTHGKKSLHVSVMGKAGESAKPAICIETKTDRLKKFDFSDVHKFTLDVYNDNDYEANVYFQYLTAAAGQNKISGEIKATAPAKTAQTVEFAIDRALLSYFLNLDDVLQIRILFDPIVQTGDAYRSFYIDNLRYYTTSKKFTSENPRKADEIESADRAEYVAAWGNILQYVYSPSSLSFNDDPQYVKNGGGSFKLVSERTDGSEPLYTVGIKCLDNALKVSDYAAVGYWAYNPGDIDLNAYVQVDKTQVGMGVLPKNAWTYFEIDKSLLDKLPFETSFENLSIEFTVPTDKKYAIYIDEVYALKDDLKPVITVENVTESYEAGDTVTVPKATVKYADGYTVKVFKPNGDLLSENEQGFVAETVGTYRVEYSATARRADSEGNRAETKETIEIIVGDVPEFAFVPADAFVATTGVYTLPALATSEDGTVTWEAEILTLFSTQNPGALNDGATSTDGTGQPDGLCVGGKIAQNAENKVYIFENCATRITYTVTSGDGISVKAYQTLVHYGDHRKLTEMYSELYDGAVKGDLTKLHAEENVLGDGGLKLTNETGSATGTFTPDNVKLGASNANLHFVVYNNGTRDAKFSVNVHKSGIVTTIPAKTYMVFHGVQFGYAPALQGWEMIGKDAERTLLPLAFQAESDAAVDVRIGCFTVNDDSYKPVIKPDYAESYTAEQTIDVNELVSIAGADVFSYEIYRKSPTDADYTDVVKEGKSTDDDTTFTFSRSGMYKVVYTVEYTDNGQTLSVQAFAEFRVISRALSFDTTPQDRFVSAGNVSVTAPTSSYGTVSWQAEVLYTMAFRFVDGSGNENHEAGERCADYGDNGYRNGVLSGTDATFSIYVPENRAVRIKYTLTDSTDADNTAVIYQTYVNFDRSALLSQFYPDLYEDATLDGLTEETKAGIFQTGAGMLRLRRSDGDSQIFKFTPPANTHLGDSIESVRLVIYNNGAKRAQVGVTDGGAGNKFYILPGCYAVYNPDQYGFGPGGAALGGWHIIDNGDLGALTFHVLSDDGAETDLYIGYITVNDGSFVPKPTFTHEASYEKDNSIDIGAIISSGYTYNYTVSRSSAEDGEYTSVQTGKSTDLDLSLELKQSGWYKITYDISYNAGATVATLTKEVAFQVINKPIVFYGVPKSGLVELDKEYAVIMPTAKSGEDNCTVTWRAELLRTLSTAGGEEAPGNVIGWDLNGWSGGVKTYNAENQDANTICVSSLLNAGVVRITYTATDADGFTATAITTYVSYYYGGETTDLGENLNDIYPDFYSAAQVTGDVTVVSDDTDGLLFGDAGAIKLVGDKSATGTFTRNVKVGGRPNTVMRYVAYNNGEQAVTLQVGRADNAVVLPAKSAYVFNASMAHKDAAFVGWGFIDNATDRILQTLNISATSAGAIDVRISNFTVESGAYEPAVTVNVAASYTDGAQVDFGTLITGGGNFSYSVRKDEAEVASGSFETHAPVSLSVGSYEITYTVAYTKGSQTLQKTIVKTFDVTALTVDLGAQAVKRIDVATYSITDNLPIVPEGSEITAWSVKIYAIGLMYNSGELVGTHTDSPATLTDVNSLYSYKIEYTVARGSKETKVVQWLLPDDGAALDATHPEVFVADNCSKNVAVGGNRGATDKVLVGTGGENVTLTFAPDVALGEGATGLTCWIMAESEAETVLIDIGKSGADWYGNGGKEISTGVWFKMNLPYSSHLKGWGIVDANDVFKQIGVKITGTGATTVYVDAFAVHS